MFLTKKFIPRRTFLRGAGVTIGLPLLDCMVPAQTDAEEDRRGAGSRGSWGSGIRTARRPVTGVRCRKARTSTSPSSPSRWSRSAIASR